MKFLKAVFQHWAVDLEKDVFANMNASIRINTKNIRIKCRVVDLAEAKAIWHDWLSFGMTVPENMRGVEQIHMSEAADRAAFSIG